jgi:hypothetical protein
MFAKALLDSGHDHPVLRSIATALSLQTTVDHIRLGFPVVGMRLLSKPPNCENRRHVLCGCAGPPGVAGWHQSG